MAAAEKSEEGKALFFCLIMRAAFRAVHKIGFGLFSFLVCGRGGGKLCRLAGNAIPAEFCLVVVRGLAICYPELFRDPAAPAEDLRRSARLAGL